MAKHKPSVVWASRQPGKYPYIEVTTHSRTSLKVMFFLAAGLPGYGVILPRVDARLLARRIQQCLEDTK